MKPICLAVLLVFMALQPVNASWVLIPGDTNDTRLHGCGSSWAICKYRANSRGRYHTPEHQRVQQRIARKSNYCGVNCQRKAFGGGGHCGANCQRKAAATFGGRL